MRVVVQDVKKKEACIKIALRGVLAIPQGPSFLLQGIFFFDID